MVNRDRCQNSLDQDEAPLLGHKTRLPHRASLDHFVQHWLEGHLLRPLIGERQAQIGAREVGDLAGKGLGDNVNLRLPAANGHDGGLVDVGP